MTSKLWLQVSLSNNLSKKKKIKILVNDEDYETAFNDLKEACSNVLRNHIKSGELPDLVMVYKPEDNLLDGDVIQLDEGDDFEGMLDEYPGGKGVRVIINTDGE